jgi:hypothetical protein
MSIDVTQTTELYYFCEALAKKSFDFYIETKASTASVDFEGQIDPELS